MTKHKNLDSLKHYVAGPTYQDKEEYNAALLKYAVKDDKTTESPSLKRKNKLKLKKSKKAKPVENVPKEQCAIKMYPEEDTEEEEATVEEGEKEDKIAEMPLVPATQQANQQNVVQNQLKQASNMFSNARFANCNFTFTLPK